jgi:hypothetical protein
MLKLFQQRRCLLMKKATIFLVLVFTLLMCSSSFAFAWAPKVDGKPDMFKPGETRGYFIWHNDNGLHMRMTTRGKEHVFSGVINTDGKFTDVKEQNLEHGDFFKVGINKDMIIFRTTTAGGIDGINFKIRGGKYVRFDLFMDGHKIDTREIYIGDNGWHPKHSDFTLHR